MRVLATTLLIGAVAAAVPQQQILRLPKQSVDALSKPLHKLQESLESLSDEARAIWDEVSTLFPEAMDKIPFFSLPKKHTRRPDSHWDHIVRGADVQSVWVEGANGEKEREIDGKFASYDLRVKKVDPSKLGVDPDIKQYSGYLDDNENDKHLFYCMTSLNLHMFNYGLQG
jgi:cathepsin A (carboxypeptidase C)